MSPCFPSLYLSFYLNLFYLPDIYWKYNSARIEAIIIITVSSLAFLSRMFGPGGGIYWHLESYWSLAGISGFQRKNGNNLDIVAICSPLACLWWRYIYMYVLCLYYTFTSCSIFLVLLDIILRNEDLKLYPFLINYIWTLTVFIHVFFPIILFEV